MAGLDKNSKIKDYKYNYMDKQLSGLDPKLAETFNRVMSTPIPTPAPISTPIVIPAPIQPSATINPIPIQAQQIMPVQPAPGPETEVTTTTQPQQAPVVINTTNSQVFSSKKKAGKVSPVILGLGGFVFLLVYTLIWVKVFGATIPFLP